MQNQNIDIETKLEDDSTLVAFLKGEIDHHTAAKIRSLLDIKIESIHPKLLVLDFTQITFMDSSGIGLVMGRYKLMKYFGGNLKIINPSPQIKKVMSLAGFDRLAVIEKTNKPKRSDYIGKKWNETSNSKQVFKWKFC